MSGSWRYLRSGYGSRNADFDIVNETGGRVASTPYEDKARILAAAPDAVEALEALMHHITAGFLVMHDALAPERRRDIENACGAAEDAIAKARGVAP